jgi:hypothetical protein
VLPDSGEGSGPHRAGNRSLRPGGVSTPQTLRRERTKAAGLRRACCFQAGSPVEINSEEHHPAGSPTVRRRAHPADVDRSPPTRKAAGFNAGCDYLPNSAMANEPDENEKKLFPKKRIPTTRTGSVGYPFIQQEATTSSSASSPEPGGQRHNDFRRSRCSNGPGSMTRSAPRLAPLSEERFAKQGLQRVRLSFTTLKRCARKPIESRPLKTEAGENPAQSRHATKGKSSWAASRCYQKPLLPEGSRGSRFHLSAVRGIDLFCFGFRGIRSKRNRRATKSTMLTTPSQPRQHLEFQKPISDRSR